MRVAQRNTSLATSLIGLLALLPSANAGISDAEFCFARSGSFRIDIDVCVRALKSESISPLTRAILYLRRGEAFLHSRAYDRVHKDINQAPLLTAYSSQAYALLGSAQIKYGDYYLLSECYTT